MGRRGVGSTLSEGSFVTYVSFGGQKERLDCKSLVIILKITFLEKLSVFPELVYLSFFDLRVWVICFNTTVSQHSVWIHGTTAKSDLWDISNPFGNGGMTHFQKENWKLFAIINVFSFMYIIPGRTSLCDHGAVSLWHNIWKNVSFCRKLWYFFFKKGS